MVLFCALWTPLFYIFWRTIRPSGGNSGELYALLTGAAVAIFRFFIPLIVDAYGFGLSRYISVFIDYTSLPVLFPLVAAMLIAHFYPRSGITDYTGFTLLSLVPAALVCSAIWSGRRDAVHLVLTPLLWTAFASVFYPLVQMVRNGMSPHKILRKTAAVLGILLYSFLASLVWWNFFRQKTIYGIILLIPSLAPVIILGIFLILRKNTADKNNDDNKKTKFLSIRNVKTRRAAVLIAMLAFCLTAVAGYISAGLARRTFVFYMADTGQELVEERMIAYTGTRETDIVRYVEEVTLGPVSLEAEPLLNRDTRLESLLLRENVVYINFSEEAAIPPATGSLADKIAALIDGIRRNFPFVTNTRIFIAGNEIFTDWPYVADN
ncbi:MAG: GerMN domain-containing protein [Spirochaetaceae bacterium]|jgi:hypothetical protein|nr:GerMN domain-containing protein [Spirochaetaceae bacterium]